MHMLIALCTNCKQHKARMLMTTEPIRDIKDIHPNGFPNSAISKAADSQIEYGKQERPRRCDWDRIRCYRCAKIPNPIKSNDHATRTSYITTSMPINFDLYYNLFCSLDCLYAETPAPVKKKEQNGPEDPRLELWKKVRDEENRESASIFSFPEVGYVLFFKFHVFKHLVDFASRNYSIVVVCKDLGHLTKHYDFFVQEFQKLSASLQDVDPPLNQIHPKYRKVPIGPANLCDEFTKLVHRSFVKMLHMPQHSIREKLIVGKLSENNQKLLELDTFTTTMLVGDEEFAAEVRKQTLGRLKSIVPNFNKADFELFIRHIVAGGQVVIQAHITHAEQLVMAIAQLLPYGCVKAKMCANTYHPEYKTMFNIVCMMYNTNIPNDPEIMKIRVNEYSKSPMIPLKSSRFTVVKRPENPEHRGLRPVVVERYLDLLHEEIVTVGIMEKALDVTKEEWLEKAKIFHFMKNNTPLNDAEVIAKIRGCDQKDLKVIKFWTNGLSEVFKQGLGKDQGIDHVEYAFDQLCVQNYESKTRLKIKIKNKPTPVPTTPPTETAQSVPPGDIQTQPNSKIVFNAPCDENSTYHMRVINSSGHRIAFEVKTTERLGVEPTCGVLDSQEASLIAVYCDAYGHEDTANDSITVEWTNTPDGADEEFSHEWFQDDEMVRRKQIPIEYNL